MGDCFAGIKCLLYYQAVHMQQMAALQALHNLIGQSHTLNINAVASAVWLGYDIMITMGEEIDRMWGTRILSPPAIAFYVSRYFSLGFLIFNAVVMNDRSLTNSFCAAFAVMEYVCVQVVSMLVNGLLGIRVNAFFHGNRRVKWFIILLWIAETILEIAISIITNIRSGKPEPFPPTIPVSGCIFGKYTTSRISIATWSAHITYSAICFALITYRFMSVYFNKSLTNELAKTFFRDGLMLFVMVCGGNVVNLVLFYAIPSSPMIVSGVAWLVASFSIASYRTILSLRGATRRGTGFTSEYELSQMRSRSIAFAGQTPKRHRYARRGQSFVTGIDTETQESTLDLDHTHYGSSPSTSMMYRSGEVDTSGSQIEFRPLSETGRIGSEHTPKTDEFTVFSADTGPESEHNQRLQA